MNKDVGQKGYRSPEQQLIDIMFQVAQRSSSHFPMDAKYDREKHMAWVATQLRECGFPTIPMGMSWGVLHREDE